MQFKMTDFLYNSLFEIINFDSLFKSFFFFLENDKKFLNNDEY